MSTVATEKPNSITTTGKAGPSTDHSPTYEVGATVEVDPATLLVDVNVRTDLQISKDFVASIKAHGVLQPVVALLTTEGALRVRYGHRRTLAAIEAEQPIRVYVAGHESDPEGNDKAAKAAGIERVLSQYAENHDRAALTTGEEVGVVEQLAAFGLSPAQIVKRSRIKRPTVDAALTVAGSALARAATDRYESLTLDQAAVVAEFEADTETVTALIAASGTGRFDHVAQRAREDRERATARQSALEALQATGVTVIDRPGNGDTARGLRWLYDDQGEQITAEAHAECPGRVAWLDQGWIYTDPEGNQVAEEDTDDLSVEDFDDLTQTYGWKAEHGCADPAVHGHSDPYSHTRGHGGSEGAANAPEQTKQEREAAKAARRLVIDNNKAWQAAETVRREWVKTFLTRKTAPKGTATFLALALAQDAHRLADFRHRSLVTEWVGDVAKTVAKATEARAQVLALGQVLACYEANLDKRDWRHDGTRSPAGRYLRFLAEVGYGLSEVEEYAVSQSTV